MIPSIGKQKIIYKDHSTVNFESLDFYILLAQKIISKMGPSIFGGLSKEMLSNEDAISFVANAIMMGDWRWKNEDNKDLEKKNKSLYSYRNQCGIWAIKTYITKKYKQKDHKNYSLNYVDDEQSDQKLSDKIADHSQKEPLDLLMEKEKKDTIQENITNLLNMAPISEKQRDYIEMYYYKDMTLEQIGKKYGVTREAVRQSIKSAINTIKQCVNNI